MFGVIPAHKLKFSINIHSNFLQACQCSLAYIQHIWEKQIDEDDSI